MSKSIHQDREISLVIAYAHCWQFDSGAIYPIQELINAQLTSRIYEFCEGCDKLKHNGKKIEGEYKEVSDITNKIILVGGSMGDALNRTLEGMASEHYHIFVSILSQLRNRQQNPVIHIPFDCTYYTDIRSDFDSSWTEVVTGRPPTTISDKYLDVFRRFSLRAYIIREDNKVIEKTPLPTLNLWDSWRTMAKYIAHNKV